MDLLTWHIWMGPMRDHSGSEFIRVLQLYQDVDVVRDKFGVEFNNVRADNDSCSTDTHGIMGIRSSCKPTYAPCPYLGGCFFNFRRPISISSTRSSARCGSSTT